MNMAASTSLAASIAAGVDKIHDSWGWFVALGIALILLGAVCVVGDMTATLASVLAFGALLIAGAVIALIQAFRVSTWSGFFLYLLSAVLRGVTGYLLVRFPFTGEMSLTLVLASFFIVGGIFRAVGAGALRFPQWGWTTLSGVISVALGVYLLVQLPTASLWFIGLAVGVDFIFDGISLVALGNALRGVPTGRALAKA
jgi:uncharacterized membrane protein HdeD (DUF308 family)